MEEKLQDSDVEEKEGHDHKLRYDYLVIALGSENNFFGNSNIQENAFTLKTITDAIILRNHLIESSRTSKHRTR